MPETFTQSIPQKNAIEVPAMLMHETAPVLNAEAGEVLREQWENFWKLRSGATPQTITDPSVLGDRNVLHHLKYDESALSNILKSGIMSGELGYQEKDMRAEDAETHYCADFFINFNAKHVSEYIAFANGPEENIGRLKVKRMESYNCPKEGNDGIALVVDPLRPELQGLMQHSTTALRPEVLGLFSVRFPKSDRVEAVARRHLAVLVGIPANFITSMIVGGKVSADSEKLAKIKTLVAESGLNIPIVNIKGEAL